ncbi:glycosyltransferase family 39 protein [Ruminococcus sp.]|uniref:ArnT family glycosyltransferase n=1 Tax=Ruminococcus sp. TaxID=41978 RepID=UPI0025DCE03D|nr:glycosyltransferase family 39 protein [Ruminococcus sp.]MBQ8967099.1 glycosyltransferase family 39 protein [Ruminococcus sp.]
MSREKLTKQVITAAGKHPYLLALVLCLFLDPFFFGSLGNIPNNALTLESFMVLGAAAFFGYRRYRAGAMDKVRLGIFLAAAAGADYFALKLYSQSEVKGLWYLAGGCVLLLILYYFADVKKFTRQMNSLLIIGLGFMMKLHYILVTSVYTRQHDVHEFGGESGHAAYMEYLLFNHSLPDFDPRERWQFVHPPLHHAISALWIHIHEDILQAGHNQARESLQMLTLFYAMCIIISAYKILRHFGLEGKALYIPLMIVSFHPAFIMFSGSINNDVLSVALSMGAVVSTLKWKEDPTLKNILKIALCVGLAMMTKVAAATVAPPIAMVFLVVFIKNFKEKGKALFGQFCAFGALCIPLGLWFGIRNLIKWKIPLTYVSEMSKDSLQYIGDKPFTERVTDFSAKQFASPFEQWARQDDAGVITGYNEYNPLVTLLKNSLFGEYINEGRFDRPYTVVFAYMLFWLNVAIVAAAVILMIYWCIKKHDMKHFFIAAFHLSLMVTFYKSSADYPFTCTMNFRYITPTVITGALFLGIAMAEDKRKIFSKAMTAAGSAFTLLTVLVFAALR